MRAGAVKKMVGGHSSSSAAAALLAMMMVMSVTKSDCFSFNDQQTSTMINVSSSSTSWCDSLDRDDDVSCLIGQIDLDSEEFMLDSEFSRRILGAAGGGGYSGKALNTGAVSCDRKEANIPCHPSGGNNNPPKEHCEERTNRGCYRYQK